MISKSTGKPFSQRMANYTYFNKINFKTGFLKTNNKNLNLCADFGCYTFFISLSTHRKYYVISLI